MILNVVIEREGDNWGAYTPDDIGSVVACGDTRDETLENFRGALKSHLAAMRAEGKVVPEIEGLEVRELVAA